jgi:hypothetical protein
MRDDPWREFQVHNVPCLDGQPVTLDEVSRSFARRNGELVSPDQQRDLLLQQLCNGKKVLELGGLWTEIIEKHAECVHVVGLVNAEHWADRTISLRTTGRVKGHPSKIASLNNWPFRAFAYDVALLDDTHFDTEALWEEAKCCLLRLKPDGKIIFGHSGDGGYLTVNSVITKMMDCGAVITESKHGFTVLQPTIKAETADLVRPRSTLIE